jgi:hypothetical protein
MMIRLQGMTIRQGVRWALVTQVALAGFLLLSEVDLGWLDPRPPREELNTRPAAPGDQVRRYEPSRPLPGFIAPALPPGVRIPDNMPSRLEFTTQTIEDFGEVLLVHGPIEPGDAERLASHVAGLAQMPEVVALNSPGGVVSEALLMGQELRERELNTIVLPGMACLSACPYILAAGTERRVSRTAAVGLHQHYYETPGYMPVFLAVEGIQYGQGQTLAYLIEMGVDPSLMVYSLFTPPQEIYVLLEEELLDTRLATEVVD